MVLCKNEYISFISHYPWTQIKLYCILKAYAINVPTLE